MPAKLEPAPINALLEKISDLEPDKIQVIARTLGQASVFNEVVREQIAGMEIGERYKTITDGFNSIRDDAKRMVDQLADGKLDVLERVDQRLDEDLARRHRRPLRQDQGRPISTSPRTPRTRSSASTLILEAYRDFRGALKQAEVLALEVLQDRDQQARRRRRPS